MIKPRRLQLALMLRLSKATQAHVERSDARPDVDHLRCVARAAPPCCSSRHPRLAESVGGEATWLLVYGTPLVGFRDTICKKTQRANYYNGPDNLHYGAVVRWQDARRAAAGSRAP